MTKIAVIGAGLIGRAWAIVFARGNFEVALWDGAADAVANALAVIRTRLDDLARAGLLDDPSGVLARIRPASSLRDALAEAVYVQENLPELLDTKRQIFAELDGLTPPEAVLASSTSSIPTSAFADGLQGRARCLVAHPVNPPYLIPLVELSGAPWTSPETISRARALLEQAGQVPIVVKREIEGFILNRLQGALLNEAFRLVEDGYVDPDDLDKTVAHGLGLRWSFMGPFETIDLNAPGGLADYCARYADMYHEMAKRYGNPKRWSPELIAHLDADRRRHLPKAQLAARQAWRDRRLMALAAHKRSVEMEDKE